MDDNELANKDLQAKLAASVAPAPAVFLNAQFEADLTELDEADAREMLADAGLEESDWISWRVSATTRSVCPPSSQQVRRKCAHGRSTKGYTAPQAAGVIHTDFEKASSRPTSSPTTISWPPTAPWPRSRRKASSVRRARDYVMADGDIVEFKFNISK